VKNTLENPEAEQSVLGSLLVSPENVREVAETLTPHDFFREDHRLIFGAMLELHGAGEPVDLVTVGQKLKTKDQLKKCGGPVFLMGLSEQVGFATNVNFYSNIVRETALRRQLKAKLQSIITEIDRADTKLGDLFDLADSQFLEIAEQYNRNGGRDRQEVFSAEDLLSRDLHPPQDIIGHGILPQGAGLFLTGDSGLGKSLLTLEMAVRMSQGLELWGLPVGKACKVLIVQAENPEYSMRFRLKRILAGLNLSQAPRLFLTPSTSRLNLSKPKDHRVLVERISELQADVVFLDPLISYHSTPENDNSQMRGFLDHLTDISRSTGAAWVLVHHHGRPQDGESRYRGASAIKDWADTFLTLAPKKAQNRILLELIFAKIRHGPGRAPLILGRDRNFIHFVSQEDGLCPPSLVMSALERLGNQCAGIGPLLKEIINMTACSERTAYAGINAAIGRGVVIHEQGRKKVYSLQRAVAVLDFAKHDCS
jgi:hypothetical protein